MRLTALKGRAEPRRASERTLLAEYSHILYAAIGWLAFLFLFFELKSKIRPVHYIHCALDDIIPFIKWFFIPYCLWYFYLLAALLYLGLTSRRDFVTLQTVLFAGMGICLLVYVFFPNAISFRPAITGGDPLSRAMAAMFSVDSPTMVTPSIHVFNTAAVHVSLVKNRVTGKNKPLIALSFILAAFICASTVFVKQHSAVDVFMGLALCLALCIPVYAAKK